MHVAHSATDRPTVAHLGAGAFHRAHQAWYTHRVAASTPEPWSIAAFTGRSATQARLLAARAGRYTLITRGAERDEFMQIDSIRSTHDGADRQVWERVLADESTRVLTLTITEAGYRLDPHGRLDLTSPAIIADLRRAEEVDTPLATAPVRLARGLAARRAAGAGPLTIVSCDNLSGNGGITRAVVLAVARTLDPSLADWIDGNVAFLSSMVDRITPRTTTDDIDEVERVTGIRDEGTVVTEPFSEWIIEEGFAGPRPPWEDAGVRFTADLGPYERRKLRILNGAHSLLAYQGLLRGFGDIAEAFGDPELRALVEEYWQTAASSCDLPIAEIAEAIDATRTRFANPRIRHRLDQIATDGAHKLPQRIVPVLAHAMRAGGSIQAPASAIAGWVAVGGHTAVEVDAVLTGIDEPDAARAVRAEIDREIRRLEAEAIGGFRRADPVRS